MIVTVDFGLYSVYIDFAVEFVTVQTVEGYSLKVMLSLEMYSISLLKIISVYIKLNTNLKLL